MSKFPIQIRISRLVLLNCLLFLILWGLKRPSSFCGSSFAMQITVILVGFIANEMWCRESAGNCLFYMKLLDKQVRFFSNPLFQFFLTRSESTSYHRLDIVKKLCFCRKLSSGSLTKPLLLKLTNGLTTPENSLAFL